MSLVKDILTIYEDLNVRALSKASGISRSDINIEMIETAEEARNEEYSYIHHVGYMIELDQRMRKNYDFEESFCKYGGDPDIIDGYLPTMQEMVKHMEDIVNDSTIDLGPFKKECEQYSMIFNS